MTTACKGLEEKPELTICPSLENSRIQLKAQGSASPPRSRWPRLYCGDRWLNTARCRSHPPCVQRQMQGLCLSQSRLSQAEGGAMHRNRKGQRRRAGGSHQLRRASAHRRRIRSHFASQSKALEHTDLARGCGPRRRGGLTMSFAPWRTPDLSSPLP